MPESTLSFASSASFRNNLIARNLTPYSVEGAYTPPAGDAIYEATPLSDSSVIDSPNDLVGTTNQANELYPLNEYGPEGGYNIIVNTNNPPYPVDPNQGEYGYDDGNLEIINEFYIDAAYIKNAYGPQGGYKDLVIITDLTPSTQFFLPYYNLSPTTFIPSQYTAFELITSDNPTGSNGPLSNDSFLAKIGKNQLSFAFNEKLAFEQQQILLSIVNLDSLQDPFEASLVATGQQPLIGKNWRITVPENPLLAGVTLLNRLTGTYFPVSLIPGDYFDETHQVLSPQTGNALNVANNLTGGLLGPILNKYRNPSELFLANTGYGQKSVLFKSLDYNKYRPSYEKGLLLGVTSAISNLIGGNTTQGGGYYVGSPQTEPSKVNSPDNEVPVDAYGKQQPSPVYGPSELGKLYEGNDTKIKFGLGGKSYTNQGGIAGQFVWVSPKYKDNLGFKVKPGGDPDKIDGEFNAVRNEFNDDTLSTSFEFKQGSILDNTQRLVESADNVTGPRRLQHVGNAINQVSKVFNDGYKEMTKGSQVIGYYDSVTGNNTIGIAGTEVGKEYCRVFQKDTPYLTYGDLQKTDGITTSGRKFTNSVLDNTFNLNIAPIRNPGSTNIIGSGVNAKVKKYMFSLENLAWRTSDRPGYTYQDLPECERGPNGGRIMWFPPYELSFSESSRAQWNPTSFLGRPEPIYTYKETTRGGNISWKIIVDHPAAMNTIIEKQLAKLSPEQVDSVMDSFFAGCVKYDLYELAAKFNNIPPDKLYTYQTILQKTTKLTLEERDQVIANIQADATTPTNGSNTVGQGGGVVGGTEPGPQTNNENKLDVTKDSFGNELNKFLNYGFYFDNDYPIGQNSNLTKLDTDFKVWYDQYIDKKDSYKTKAPQNVNVNGVVFSGSSVPTFFTEVVEGNFNLIQTEFLKKIEELITKYNGSVEIELMGSASAPGKVPYNQKLSQRRISVVENWFNNQTINDRKISDLVQEKRIKFTPIPTGEKTNIITTENNNRTTVNCTVDVKLGTTPQGKITQLSQWYSVPAMACRRVGISKITITDFTPPTPPTTTTTTTPPTPPTPPSGDTEQAQFVETIVIEETIDKKIKDGISKEVLRSLFSECNYFQEIEESNPMVYSSFKDKIKFFNPAFHSMTPEGLNGRLTFLQQCVRPGQTIPVIGPDGKPKYNDARNTSFGAPPVLVLRVGDFFHSKIIPNDLQITYEPLLLDLNPEGIGVQPMLAKISLGFDFIGGHGLANPVQQLQNALSFNFYANTEIYDERSVATESTKDKDEKLVQQIISRPTDIPATNGDIQNIIPETGGSTIGKILSTSNFDDGEYQTGEIEYTNIFKELSTTTNNYFKVTVNQLKSINEVANYPTLQILQNVRQFNKGKVGSIDTEIYGKMVKYENEITELIKKTLKDIDDDLNPIFVTIKNGNYSKQTKREFKNKLYEIVAQQESKILDNTNGFINEITKYQENYVQIFKRLDLVNNNKIDGYKLETGKFKVYNINDPDNNTKFDNFNAVYPTKTVENLNEFQKLLNSKKIIDDNFITNYDLFTFTPKVSNILISESDKRFYIVMSSIFTDDAKYKTFVESIITERVKLNTDMENTIKATCEKIKNEHKLEFDAEKKIFTDFDVSPEYKVFTTFTIDEFDSKIKYTTLKDDNTKENKKLLKDAYSDLNTNKKKDTFNGKITFD